MRRKKITTWLGVAFASLTATIVHAQAPNPNEVYIRDVYHGGNGCPQGTVDTYVSSNGKVMTLVFDQYIAELGPGVPAGDARKFCNIGIDLHIPNGWQYSIFEADYRGYADIPRGVTGLLQSSYRFSGSSSREVTLRNQIRGPFSDNYEKNDVLGVESLVWSQCGTNVALNLKTEARLTGPRTRPALFTVDTIDGQFTQVYHLNWRRCR